MLFDENTGIGHMLSAFDQGKREHFFITWNRFVPIGHRANDLKCQKLEFYIHIYFAIFPALPENSKSRMTESELKKELAAFKVFLDTKGSELSQTSEFLPYYALPYVQNPLEHPHFGSLCSKKWALGLKNELADWLRNNFPKLSTPTIFQWYASFKKSVSLFGSGSAAALDDKAPLTSNAALESVQLEELKDKFIML